MPALPAPGEILHLEQPLVIAAGGGGIAFFQFARSPAELHLFTALGNDDAARSVERRVTATSAHVHAARRDEPHTRDLVLVTPDAERTILVVGEPLHPRHDDPLPWDTLGSCDAAYFTAQDPEVLKLARNAGFLAVTARRSHALAASGVRADVVIGSTADPRESSVLADYAVPPRALVMTDGRRGGTIETTDGVTRFAAPRVSSRGRCLRCGRFILGGAHLVPGARPPRCPRRAIGLPAAAPQCSAASTRWSIRFRSIESAFVNAGLLPVHPARPRDRRLHRVEHEPDARKARCRTS